MYVLSTSQTQNQGLERHCRDPGIDRTTVVRDSENAKYAGFDYCSGSKIHLNLGTGCDTRKENDFRDGDDRSSGCGNPAGLS